MKRIVSFFKLIENFGVEPSQAYLQQREIAITNRISLIMIPLCILGLFMSYFREIYFTAIGFVILLVFLFIVFPLNKSDKSFLSRLTLSILPQLFLLFLNVLGGVSKVENYIAFSYLFLGFTFIPLLLFRSKKDFGFLILALTINLMVILFFDVLLLWSERNIIDMQLIENNYIYFKMPQIILWFLIVGAFQYIKNESNHSEKRFQSVSNELKELNDKYQIQNENINTQNESLIEYQVKTEKQKNQLGARNNELDKTKLELLKSIGKIKELKEKLLQEEALTKSIFNALNEHYLVAQYDLDGKLQSINTKVIELLGVLHDEHFQDIKSTIINSGESRKKSLNGHSFNKIWKRIANGEAQTIELEYQIGEKTICLATTFVPLFDANKNPFKVLAIGHDVSEMKEKNKKIDIINEELKEKIFEISQQNELLNFQQSEIFDKSEELHRQKEEILAINESLEKRVQERTKVLEDKNKQLTEYAFINSHVLRSPVSTMKGLINLMKYSDLPDEEKKIYMHLKETANVLDNVVFKINNAIGNGLHFDRAYLEPERNFYPNNSI